LDFSSLISGSVFFLSIYKEHVLVFYATLQIVIFKYFSEFVDQLLFTIIAVFLYMRNINHWISERP
jgi:hypothetical protein